MLSRYDIVYECLTHTGNVRGNNEDNYLCAGEYLPALHSSGHQEGRIAANDPLAVFGIFDGMGGEAFGEQSSYLAASNAPGSKQCGDLAVWFRQTIESMNLAICQWAKEEGVPSTGSTAVMTVFDNREAVYCNVGDSRLYLFRDGILRMLSQDHVIKIANREKGLLSQCLGTDPQTTQLLPFIGREPLAAGDIFLLCSDGLTDMLSDEDIRRILQENSDRSVEKLVDAALKNGGHDNITVMVLKAEKRSLKNRLKDLIKL